MTEISDLPIENNKRWAQDQQNTARAQIKEDLHVAGPAQVDVTEPSYSSAVKALVGQDQTNIPWAIIEAPEIYHGARRSDLFRTDLIPRLGNNEKLMTLKERLESLPETLHGR